MSNLDLNHLESYSDEEVVRFLDHSEHPLTKDVCRRLLRIRNLMSSEVEEAQDNLTECEGKLESAERELKDTELELHISEKRVVQLEQFLEAEGIQVPKGA